MEQRILTVGGLRSPALCAGDGASPQAVVFVHGNPGSCRDWLGLIEQVAPFSRAFAPDLPGFGKADRPADFDYTVAGYARHLGRLIASQGIARVHLVLHDFGGPWGLQWAAEHPDRVASVTLLNIGALPGYRWHYLARIWRTPLIGELFMALTNRPGLRLALRHGNPRGLPQPFFDEMYANYDAGTRRAILKLYRNTSDLGALAELAASALAPRRIPALVVWGARDPYVPVKFAEMQRRFFAVEQVVRLEDSGHWPMIDNPAAVAQAVLPFLRSQTGRA
ncbi:alpha/beta hydrolase [Roseateles sp.]|uniref:alpha/beta fold hydrolase n=1 Tax=Roseateles sp. TaxID=1971397 RepID=UPI0025E5529A|nr:alpha/beta hydrolase [Roseateles sp.]MBV8033509.1 alpha/beta hydrolase [Roseateles sp.]